MWTGSQMIVWGGTAIAQDHATGAVYSPEADPGRPWQSMPPAPLDGGAGPATAWTGREAFVFTGATALYSLEQDRWRSLADPPVSPSHPLAASDRCAGARSSRSVDELPPHRSNGNGAHVVWQRRRSRAVLLGDRPDRCGSLGPLTQPGTGISMSIGTRSPSDALTSSVMVVASSCSTEKPGAQK